MTISLLFGEVEATRENFIQSCMGLTPEQAQFKPSADSWSITEVAEHIVRAEWGGVNGIWGAIEGYRSGKPVWSGDNVNEGLSIETIVERTWLAHQPAPEPARPQWGGALDFWLTSLRSCKSTLTEALKQLDGLDPASIIYPHPLSGPLNVYQRLEFLRYHMQRHQRQIENIRKQMPSQ